MGHSLAEVHVGFKPLGRFQTRAAIRRDFDAVYILFQRTQRVIAHGCAIVSHQHDGLGVSEKQIV